MKSIVSNKNKTQDLIKSKERIKERLKKIDEIFKQEKENEEAWPGHAGNLYQAAENESIVLKQHLSMIEIELNKIGYKEKNEETSNS